MAECVGVCVYVYVLGISCGREQHRGSTINNNHWMSISYNNSIKENETFFRRGCGLLAAAFII